MRRRALLGVVTGGGLAGLAGCLFASPDASGVPNDDGGGADGDETTTTATTDDSGTTTAAASTTTTDDDGTTTATSDVGETTTTTATETTTADPGPQESVTVVVGGEGGTRYEPQEFRLAVGGTVRWVWEGNGHNVIPTEQPGGAEWEGTAGSNSRTYDAGHEYTHTFDVVGEYAYRCFTHGNFGMVGSFTVE